MLRCTAGVAASGDTPCPTGNTVDQIVQGTVTAVNPTAKQLTVQFTDKSATLVAGGTGWTRNGKTLTQLSLVEKNDGVVATVAPISLGLLNGDWQTSSLAFTSPSQPTSGQASQASTSVVRPSNWKRFAFLIVVSVLAVGLVLAGAVGWLYFGVKPSAEGNATVTQRARKTIDDKISLWQKKREWKTIENRERLVAEAKVHDLEAAKKDLQTMSANAAAAAVTVEDERKLIGDRAGNVRTAAQATAKAAEDVRASADKAHRFKREGNDGGASAAATETLGKLVGVGQKREKTADALEIVKQGRSRAQAALLKAEDSVAKANEIYPDPKAKRAAHVASDKEHKTAPGLKQAVDAANAARLVAARNSEKTEQAEQLIKPTQTGAVRLLAEIARLRETVVDEAEKAKQAAAKVEIFLNHAELEIGEAQGHERAAASAAREVEPYIQAT